MRLRRRRKVDLPQPDGPIRAMTERSGTTRVMSHSACLAPYQKETPLARNLERTPCFADGSRPLRLRSEMMAEYDSVDIEVASGLSGQPPVHCGVSLWSPYVFLMKKSRRFGKP